MFNKIVNKVLNFYNFQKFLKIHIVFKALLWIEEHFSLGFFSSREEMISLVFYYPRLNSIGNITSQIVS